jgi:autotransporter-associated beta strand protein
VDVYLNGQFSNASGEAGNLTFASPNTKSGWFFIQNGLGYTGTTKLINNTKLILVAGEIASDISIDTLSRFSFSTTTNLTYSRNISGSGQLDFGGSGSVTLTGNNAGFTGRFFVGSGSVIGNTTSLQGDIVNDSAVTFDQAGAGTYAGAMSGSGSLTKLGNGAVTLTGANSYSGRTNFNAGTLNVGSSGALGSGTLSFGGGTLQYSSSNTTDYSSRFSSAANQLYRIDTNGQNITFASALTSSGGSLTKLGAGALTLSGANSYSGGTNFNGGTRNVGSSGA